MKVIESAGSRGTVVVDAIVIVAGWILFAFWVGRGHGVTAYDALRDLAYAQGIRAGHLGADPTIPGYAAWYPPGLPILLAGLSFVTRQPVVAIGVSSLYWLGWTLPLSLHALVRACAGRVTAWIALPMVFLGSLWWLTHAAMPMASVQAVPLGLLAVLAWSRAGWASAVVAGVLAGVTFWFHPLCGVVVLGAVLGHGLLAPWAGRAVGGAPRTALLARAGVVGAIALVLAAPQLVQQANTLRHVEAAGGNMAAFHWFAPELHDPRFALHAHAPFVSLLGLLGLALAARRWRERGWLVAYFVTGLAGSLLGYVGHDLGVSVPWVLPHEFQWHEQLALGVAASLALVALADGAARRVSAASRGAVRIAAGAGLLLLAVGPALTSAPMADAYPMRLDDRWSSLLGMASWVRAHTAPASVFVSDPEAAYDIAGLTGRFCVALPPGHMNPAADIDRRMQDLARMLSTSDEHEFLPLARRYGASYLLVAPPAGLRTAARAVYDRWSCLEPAFLPDSALFLYRIVPGAASGTDPHRP